MTQTFNILIIEMRKVHSKLFRIKFSVAERSGQREVDNVAGWRRKGKKSHQLEPEKAALPHGKILILKFTLLLTSKLKGITCNCTWETRASAFK